MTKSIVQKKTDECFLCGRNGAADRLECHHIFFGAANRRLSDEDGLTVYLCGNRCHRAGIHAVHRCKETDAFLKEEAQMAWEQVYGTRDDFIKRYGKSYL